MNEAENLSSTENVQSSGEDSQESFSLAPPTKIGRYTILRRLGKGGFGEVFQGFDDDLNRPVAIKVPRPERVSRPEDIEAYLKEARIVASLDHPHIVPVHDVGRTEFFHVVNRLRDATNDKWGNRSGTARNARNAQSLRSRAPYPGLQGDSPRA